MIKESTTQRKYPQLKDSLSYIYIEHAIVEQDAFSIAIITENGRTPIPIAGTTCLLLGPGTTITHAAVRSIADCGCMIVWCGENMRKYYAFGHGDTQSGRNIIHQAKLMCNDRTRLEVVRNMYLLRFPQMQSKDLTLERLRGMEGVRVKQAYKSSSKGYGVPWRGRNYQVRQMDESDTINRALTLAFDFIYSISEAAIISLGYSPAIGFIHTGNARSFVYDVADFYKTDIAIPAAFEAVASAEQNLDATVRKCCRKRIHDTKFLARIAKDIATVLNVPIDENTEEGIWAGQDVIDYGVNYGEE